MSASSPRHWRESRLSGKMSELALSSLVVQFSYGEVRDILSALKVAKSSRAARMNHAYASHISEMIIYKASLLTLEGLGSVKVLLLSTEASAGDVRHTRYSHSLEQEDVASNRYPAGCLAM